MRSFLVYYTISLWNEKDSFLYIITRGNQWVLWIVSRKRINTLILNCVWSDKSNCVDFVQNSQDESLGCQRGLMPVKMAFQRVGNSSKCFCQWCILLFTGFNLQSKSMDWFLYDNNFRHEKVNIKTNFERQSRYF